MEKESKPPMEKTIKFVPDTETLPPMEKTIKFVPDTETLPPIGDLMTSLIINADVVASILQQFVDNSPVPELARLVLAEPED